MNCLQIIAVIASVLVAIGTGALAFATFRMIRKTDKWNQRLETRTLEWNQRNEWMRVLPLTRITAVPPIRSIESHPGWIKAFDLIVKNVGLGPIVTMKITVTQGENRRFECHPPPTVVLGVPTWPQGLHVFQSSSPIKKFEKEIHNIECLRLRFELKNDTPEPLKDKEPCPLKIEILLRDVFRRKILINYKLLPVHIEGAYQKNLLGTPFVTSLNIDGEEMLMPEAEEYQDSQYRGYQSQKPAR